MAVDSRMHFLSPCFESSLSIHNAVNGTVMNAKPFSQLNLVPISWNVQFPYFFNLFIRQFTRTIFPAIHWMLRASQFTTLIAIITHVIRSGAYKKVGWIHTGRIVSLRAIVTDIKSVWDCSKMQNPTRSVRQLHSFSSSTPPNQPVSFGKFPSHPQPTRFGVFNLRKKTGRKTDIKSLLFEKLRCNVRHSSVLSRFGLLARPALLFSLNRPVLSTLFFSLLLAFSAFGQPAPINRRALVLTGLASNPFTPDQAPNLTLWFRADSGTFQNSALLPAVTNNSPVYIWQDKSGNGHHLTNQITTTFPTNTFSGPSGSNAIWFVDTTNVRMTNADVLASNHWTLFCVASKNLDSANQIGIVIENNYAEDPINSSDPLFGFRSLSFPAISTFWTMLGPGSVSSVGLTNSVFYYVTATYTTNASHNIIRTNGVPFVTMGNGTKLNQWYGIIVGRGPAATSYNGGLAGYISEIILYAGDMYGTANLTNVEVYLKNRYHF